MNQNISMSRDVAVALAHGHAVVALESTIITHGMPYPENYRTALLVENEIREHRAVPATVAILEGELKVGLSANELKKLAQAKDVHKVSRADLAATMAAGRTGATTVAATMIAAAQAGISTFATGGIGGVHRGVSDSYDISADLNEFCLSPVNVVAAGAKAILDIPKTLEVLETLGVPVITCGQDEFPAFWSRDSGLKSPLRIDDAEQIAAAFLKKRDLGIAGGQLIANPIPIEDEIPRAEILPVIENALKAAEKQGISQKEVTPFLLAEIFTATKGKSLEANIALVLNNARLAARIARHIAEPVE